MRMELMIPALQSCCKIQPDLHPVSCGTLSVGGVGAGGQEGSVALTWDLPLTGELTAASIWVRPPDHMLCSLAFPTPLPCDNMLTGVLLYRIPLPAR